MTDSQLPEVLRRVSHLAQRRLEDVVVVMDLRQGRLYGFNPAGGELLDWLKSGRSLAAVREAIAGAPESESEEFLRRLVELGLIDEAPVAETSDRAPAALLEAAPRLLWQEEAVRVTNQVSPPQALTNPQCQP